MLTRRIVLLLPLVLCALVAPPQSAEAGVARALTLGELSRQSDRVVVGSTIEALSRWENIGRTRRIVTYSRMRVDQVVAGSPAGEIWVRTLGGHVGTIGQIVHGEAQLSAAEPSLLFVRDRGDGTFAVTGMAQGCFWLRATVQGALELRPNPGLSVLVNGERSAVGALAGKKLGEAVALVRGARGKP